MEDELFWVPLGLYRLWHWKGLISEKYWGPGTLRGLVTLAKFDAYYLIFKNMWFSKKNVITFKMPISALIFLLSKAVYKLLSFEYGLALCLATWILRLEDKRQYISFLPDLLSWDTCLWNPGTPRKKSGSAEASTLERLHKNRGAFRVPSIPFQNFRVQVPIEHTNLWDDFGPATTDWKCVNPQQELPRWAGLTSNNARNTDNKWELFLIT